MCQYIQPIFLPDLHLSVLPSVISDCATVFMEYKKMKIDEDQFNKKCKIIKYNYRNYSTTFFCGRIFVILPKKYL